MAAIFQPHSTLLSQCEWISIDVINDTATIQSHGFSTWSTNAFYSIFTLPDRNANEQVHVLREVWAPATMCCRSVIVFCSETTLTRPAKCSTEHCPGHRQLSILRISEGLMLEWRPSSSFRNPCTKIFATHYGQWDWLRYSKEMSLTSANRSAPRIVTLQLKWVFSRYCSMMRFLAAVGITLVRHSCFNTHLMRDGLPKRQALQAKNLVFESF